MLHNKAQPVLVLASGVSLLATALWFICKVKKDDDDIVSSRGRRALNPPLPYLGAFFQALNDPCDVKDNPEGHIALCVAENKLILNELSSRLNRSSVAEAAFCDGNNYCYNDMRGMMHVRESVARFITRKFLKPQEGSDNAVKAENVILGS